MRITIFGAAGSVGRDVVTEARSRGHEVTAVSRRPAAGLVPADAGRVEDVVALSAGQHLVISATRPAPGSEDELVTTARTLLAGLARTGVRLLLVGGAATLTVPGTGGRTLLEDPELCPPAWHAIARACAAQLAACRAATRVDWAYLSPPALLLPGERTGGYRLGTDELLTDPEGRSAISTADLAVALLDEAERPRHDRARFTVAY
jgi:putative NADH-flavin reductase